MLKSQLISSLKAFLVLSFICGLLYPFFVYFLGSLLFPWQVAGSLLQNKQGITIGSALIGQRFLQDRYFWGRPSAGEYAAVPSKASQLSPASKILQNEIAQRAKIFGAVADTVPADLLTTSASGLDPHISFAAAVLQVKRIAMARGIAEQQIVSLIEKEAFLRSPQDRSTRIVNVLALNMALEGELSR